MFSPEDTRFMTRALELAKSGLYSTTPNPRVGCVLVKNGQIIAEGWHKKAGEAHAEINALQVACSQAEGATAYVTLEPCSHYGRTPPCSEALIRAKISRVVCAMQDPNPKVSGNGLKQLNEAGIQTVCGLLQTEAEDLNIGFISRMRRNRPWFRSKLAASLDGKTALNNGQSQWITSPAARQDGHLWRARACAILTGIGTVKADNPQLNVRQESTDRQPLKIVLDSRFKISSDAALLQAGQVLIVTAMPESQKNEQFEKMGIEVISLPNQHGKVDLQALALELGKRQLNEVHIEAGAILNGAFLAQHLTDELLIYLAPCLLGNAARGMLDMPELTSLTEKTTLAIKSIESISPDIRIIANTVYQD